MKVFLLICATILGAGIPLAYSQNQQELNHQAAEDFEKADARLNTVYKKLLASLDSEGREKLVASERAWLAFRDAEAAYQADSERGGSLAPLIYSSTEAQLTEQRIKMVQQQK